MHGSDLGSNLGSFLIQSKKADKLHYCFENGYKPKAKIPFSKDAKVAGLIKTRKTPSEPFIYYI